MPSLEKLGIECSYDPNKPNELHYSISIESDRLKNPGQTREYFTEIINAIADDADYKKRLEHLTLSVDDKYREDFHSITRNLRHKAEEHKRLRYHSQVEKWPTFCKVASFGGLIAGGITGLILSYNQMAEWATDAAEYMNNSSHLWAPITGLTQAAISIGGTLLTTALGALIGEYVGVHGSVPYLRAKTPLAPRIKQYRSLEQALFQTETTAKETA